MKFKSKDTINLRSGASLNSPAIGKIQAGTIVESDEYNWKAVTLPDGRKGYCAGEYLEKVIAPPAPKWFAPIRADKFKLTQKFYEADWLNYPKTGHHPGADYGTQGEDNVPLYFCTDGEVIESGVSNYFGNYFFYYVAEVDRTFLYFHLRDKATALGKYKGGVQCGITGKTGLAFGAHLHIECMKGKKTSADRKNLYTSAAALLAAAEDPDAFLRARI